MHIRRGCKEDIYIQDPTKKIDMAFPLWLWGARAILLATPQLLPPLHQKAEGFQHPKNCLSLGFPAQALNPHQLASQGPPNSKKAALSKEETFLLY